MERENTQNSKRARDEKREPDHYKGNKRSSAESVCDSYENYEFCDGFGVFEFPWLKEGMIFIADEYLGTEEKLASYSFLDETFAANLDPSGVQNLYSYSPAAMDEHNFHEKKQADEDGFWSLEIDDFERLDCIWSCPCDKPLDIGLKGRL